MLQQRQLWRAPARLLHLQQQQRARIALGAVRHFSASSPVEKVHKRQVTIHVTSLSDQGDGVGVDAATSVPVHVPFAVPGEELVVDVWDRDVVASAKWQATQRAPKWPVFGQRRQELASSIHRTTPQCTKYFGVCGGCKLQHVAYTEQLRHKQLRVAELFDNRSHSPAMELRAIIGAETDDETFAYRNKMEFTCSTGRWLLDSDKAVDTDSVSTNANAHSDIGSAPVYPFTIGLFPVASTSVRRARQLSGKRRRGKTNASWSPRILSIDACALQSDASNTVLQQLASQLEASGLAAFDFHSTTGFLKQLVIRSGTDAHGAVELMIGFVTTTLDGDDSMRLRSVVEAVVDSFNSQSDAAARIVSVVQRLDEQAARNQNRNHEGTTDSPLREKTLVGQPFFHDSILGHTFEVAFDAFFQPNTAMASRLYREIQHTLASQLPFQSTHSTSVTPPRKPVIWDLFCGVGSIGICMGSLGAKVYGFELVEAAVERARANAMRNGYDSATMQFFPLDLTKRWDAVDTVGIEIEHPDVVIVDPPRAGLHAKLIKMLRRLGPAQICYVSCNPESQVRDLELLCSLDTTEATAGLAAYDVEVVQPVDMLPHTPHIETIAWLRKRTA